jgi:hypothetical protein
MDMYIQGCLPQPKRHLRLAMGASQDVDSSLNNVHHNNMAPQQQVFAFAAPAMAFYMVPCAHRRLPFVLQESAWTTAWSSLARCESRCRYWTSIHRLQPVDKPQGPPEYIQTSGSGNQDESLRPTASPARIKPRPGIAGQQPTSSSSRPGPWAGQHVYNAQPATIFNHGRLPAREPPSFLRLHCCPTPCGNHPTAPCSRPQWGPQGRHHAPKTTTPSP